MNCGIKVLSALAGLYCSCFSQELIEKPLVFSTENQVIDGKGRILKLKNGVNCPVIIIGDEKNVEPELSVSNITIKNFVIDGNKDGQQTEYWENIPNGFRNNGITIRAATNIKIEHCKIFNCRSGGIVIEKKSSNIKIENCNIYDCHYDGIAGYESDNCFISNCKLSRNLGAGLSFDLQFNDFEIKDCAIKDNNIGFFLRNCKRGVLLGNTFSNTKYDLYINQVDDDINTLPENINYALNKYETYKVKQKMLIELNSSVVPGAKKFDITRN